MRTTHAWMVGAGLLALTSTADAAPPEQTVPGSRAGQSPATEPGSASPARPGQPEPATPPDTRSPTPTRSTTPATGSPTDRPTTQPHQGTPHQGAHGQPPGQQTGMQQPGTPQPGMQPQRPPADVTAQMEMETAHTGDDVLLVIDLPLAVTEARAAGVDDKEIDALLRNAREGGVSAAETGEILLAETVAIRSRGTKKGFSHWTMSRLARGEPVDAVIAQIRARRDEPEPTPDQQAQLTSELRDRRTREMEQRRAEGERMRQAGTTGSMTRMHGRLHHEWLKARMMNDRQAEKRLDKELRELEKQQQQQQQSAATNPQQNRPSGQRKITDRPPQGSTQQPTERPMQQRGPQQGPQPKTGDQPDTRRQDAPGQGTDDQPMKQQQQPGNPPGAGGAR